MSCNILLAPTFHCALSYDLIRSSAQRVHGDSQVEQRKLEARERKRRRRLGLDEVALTC